MTNLDPAERIEKLNKFLMEEMGPIELPPGGMVPPTKKKEEDEEPPYVPASLRPVVPDYPTGSATGRGRTPSLSPAEIAARKKTYDDAQTAKFKKQEADVQRLRAAGNENATRFYPRWNVRGQERVNQLRGYLDYLRADPDRLRLFKQQRDYASSRFPEQAERARTAYDRSAASTAQRIADYQAGDRARRLGGIRAFDPEAANALERAYRADERGKKAAQQWGQIGSDIGKEMDNTLDAQSQRKIDRFKANRQLEKETQAAMDKEAADAAGPGMSEAEADRIARATTAVSYPDMESRRGEQLSRQKPISQTIGSGQAQTVASTSNKGKESNRGDIWAPQPWHWGNK